MIYQKASREVDATIAERLMGWTHLSPDDYKYGYPPEFSGRREAYTWPGRTGTQRVPAYSTSMEAAWQIVIKLRQMGYGCTIRSYSGTVEVWKLVDGEHYAVTVVTSGNIHTVPLVICNAAIEVLEREQ